MNTVKLPIADLLNAKYGSGRCRGLRGWSSVLVFGFGVGCDQSARGLAQSKTLAREQGRPRPKSEKLCQGARDGGWTRSNPSKFGKILNYAYSHLIAVYRILKCGEAGNLPNIKITKRTQFPKFMKPLLDEHVVKNRRQNDEPNFPNLEGKMRRAAKERGNIQHSTLNIQRRREDSKGAEVGDDPGLSDRIRPNPSESDQKIYHE